MKLASCNTGFHTPRPTRAIRCKLPALPGAYMPVRRRHRPGIEHPPGPHLRIEGFPLSCHGPVSEKGPRAVFARMGKKAAQLKRAGGQSDSLPGTGNAETARHQEFTLTAAGYPDVRPMRAEAKKLYAQIRFSLAAGA